MAEAFLNQIGGAEFAAHSAGIEPGKLNPVVVAVMKEVGMDISGNQTKSTADMMVVGKTFAYIITVCDEASAERCPVFPGGGTRLHWGFPDPSQVQGSDDNKRKAFREVMFGLKKRIDLLAALPLDKLDGMSIQQELKNLAQI